MRGLLILPALLAGLSAGCAGGGSAPKPQPAPAVQAKPEVSYEQVKRLALAAPGVNCKKTEDQKLGPVLRGEIYKRLSCDGKGIVDYVVGQAAVDTQFGPARRINPRDPLWRGRQGPTLVSLGVAVESPPGLRALPEAIRGSCGCGEVVAPLKK